MANRKFYNLAVNNRKAELNIFGDICSGAWEEFGEASQKTVADALNGLEVDEIEVHLNSYGGDVKEGMGIYNTLKNHSAKVTTICDGMACSIASVIFMAGDERLMNESSLLMIHNAWTCTMGNAEELRKTADELDTMMVMLKNAYLSRVNISEEDLTDMLDAETWILPEDAVKMGFATEIIAEEETLAPAASVRKSLANIVRPQAEEVKPMSVETVTNLLSGKFNI